MTELLSRLTEYAEGNMIPFHMPGHKRDPGLFLAGGEDLQGLSALYGIDITEIEGFDNLHDPEGILKEAEERAAKAYGSAHTHFLVNGSTAGILSAVSAVASRADLAEKGALLVARNCHKSVYHAAFLNRLHLRYLYPSFDEEYGIGGKIRPSDVREAIRSAREEGLFIAGIVITSPTYEGIVSDIGAIVREAHEFGIPLIADEAHGAHFGFYPSGTGEAAFVIPENAVRLGADLVIHSVHKTLPAPTQTALIHINGDIVSDDLVRKYLRIYQTSSPSYPLMAGIDAAVSLMAKKGPDLLSRMIGMRQDLQSEISDLRCIKLCPYTEPGKILISVKGAVKDGVPYMGKDLSDELRKSHRIELEMACGTYALGILTVADSPENVKSLAEALRRIDAGLSFASRESASSDASSDASFEDSDKMRPEAVIPFYEAYGMDYEEIPLSEATGRIAAELTGIYPPGSPYLVPGEVWSEGIAARVERDIRNGLHTEGVRDGLVRVLPSPGGQKRFI